MRRKRNLLFTAAIISAILALAGCQFAPGDYPEPTLRTRPAEAALLLNGYTELPGERFVLTGDLHCHSGESNGSGIPTSRVLADSIKAGYDFVALTDHGTVDQNKYDWSTDELLVLSGLELGTNLGHFNILGLTEMPNLPRIDSTEEEFNTYIDYLHGLGALIQHNHPNRGLDPSVPFTYNLNTDFVEILNRGLNDEDKRTLQRDFYNMLAAGKSFVGTAGSDAHRDYTSRHEFNNVWVTERTEVAVLYALNKGHSYVTTAADGPVIQLTCGTAIMGDTVSCSTGQSVDINITALAEGSIVKVLNKGGLVLEQAATSSSLAIRIPTQSSTGLVRVEIWGSDGSIIAFSNPLYIS
ncbi:MAG: CehA/McbA family metallohydrolase [Sphaerochaetaceae bacterium]